VRLGLGEIYQRIARDLVQILAAVTEDGFVHRTDLRLRPDPASTPRAISTTAAEIYYESVGQNWERAAMIKARPVGGDQAAGLGFLKRLRPFIWRRHLDFAAIADIQSIKRQITSKVGASAATRLRSDSPDEPSPRLITLTRGHNVKLGSGGIREIEFFAQTQQLIWGGRLPELRLAETCRTLNKLAELGLISETVAADMVAAYRELRRVEHRLQMVEDQQTHSLPTDDHELERFSRFMGYGSVPEFYQALDPVLSLVALHFGQLFADQPTLGSSEPRPRGEAASESRNLVFTGTEDDPDTLQTLAQLGYSQPDQVAEMIRGWHYGRIRATRSARSRELLTELIPALLAAFAATVEPQQAFVRLDRFLSSLPAGVEVLTLLKANPNLLTRLAEIMGTAPELAEILSTHPHLLDALVLSSGLVKQANRTGDLQSRDQYRHQLLAVQGDCDGLEDILDSVRRWAAEQRFHIGIALLQRQLAPRLAVREYSQIAEAIIAVLLETVYAEFTRIHGFLPGGSLAVLGYGKLGGENPDSGFGSRPGAGRRPWSL
ncbi:MAG: glutamine-synthetase adenylyltransferase, partial [Alphaproteobacteria bacterium]|nr:glutamine-synthetase adenylyltransferase [Alphaproteobacteria bacterium]